MCVITSAAAAQNSIAKSRSLTASSEFSQIESKPSFLRDQRAIDRIRRPGQRRSAERQAVDALARIEQALAVALEHLGIGQQMVAERHGLRDLHVGESRHHGGGVPLGQLDQRVLQPVEQAHDSIDFAAQLQAQCRSRSGRCASGRYAGACRRRRPDRSGAVRCSGERLRARCASRTDRARSLPRICGNPRSMSARSAAPMMSHLCSIAACASEPSMSANASLRSNPTEPCSAARSRRPVRRIGPTMQCFSSLTDVGWRSALT